MFSLKGFLQYCIVTRLLVILFVNPSSCVSHAQPSSFTFVNFNSSYLEQIILVDDAIQWESKYILLDSVNTAFGEGRYYGCGKLIYKEKVQMLHPSTEISVISQIRHRNLVQLRGWCQEKENLLLVYDYMSNKSLDKWLFETPGILDVQSPHVLQWEVRYNIVTGVAGAVHYLHEEWEQCIIHRDIKASNVLLDAQFQAHLGNFGLARFTDHDKSSRTTMLAGTLGYLAPELQHTGKATKSTDVYSFGILALEIACGRSALSEIDSQSQLVLLDYVWQEHKNKSIFNVVDPRLEMNFVEDQMLRVLHVGLLCCHPVPLVRPSMRLVYQYLKGDKSVPSPPKFEPMAISY
ncbi:unnamed protein product [Sphagnum jensenii]|uniref:Protein kinase domain-containing protein n=1 Tax=Sphagnum jensenii TaxID=128206 RepID=A0ABP0WR65_9BRYO